MWNQREGCPRLSPERLTSVLASGSVVTGPWRVSVAGPPGTEESAAALQLAGLGSGNNSPP